MDTTRQQRLAEFVDWTSHHIRGDEKGEAHIFLDHLFRAFGQPGSLDVGGQPEYRIRKAKEDGGGTAFADYVWKPVVLIEMKKRGQNLAKHYRQAFDYWIRLAPNRPKYVVLCNFDEFWVYDFDSAQIDTPLDMVLLKELPEKWGPLAFLFPTDEKPVFGNDHEAVTRDAADRLATCFNKLITRRIERPRAQRFILQVLVSLFAEDIGLLQKYTVTQLLDDCHSPRDTYDLLGGLFVEMNTPGRTPGGRYKGVEYFNGGLFAEPVRIELASDELNQLKQAAREDWSKVRPEIFGTLFEHSLGHEERHAFGAHFTSPIDIMKIVVPTITQPWQQAIDAAKTRPKLRELLERLQHFRVLDPACGSGNFLYLAYREMKRLEARLIERLKELSSKTDKSQMSFGFVTAAQFFGLDINPFAVELAKVTMMIARKLAIDELHVTEASLPLDNLDNNFIVTDALIDPLGNPTAWPPADVIIGNPPFLGAKRLKPEHGPDYVNAVRRAYPEVPGMADYCVYWFRKAHDHLPDCTPADPLAGRAGLVGTQNIRNNQSRVGGLDHIAATGTIIEAVDNQPWSGEANVHVSIANWVKTQDAKLLPSKRRLWFKDEPAPGKKKPRTRGSGPATKEYELAYRDCDQINSTLSDQTDLSGANVLACNAKPAFVFQGQVTGHPAYILAREKAAAFIAADPRNEDVVLPFLIGRDLVTGTGQPTRFVIDFQGRDILAAQAYRQPFNHLEQIVLPSRQQKAEEGKADDGGLRPHHQLFLRYWWRQAYERPEMIAAIQSLPRYIVCSAHTKRPIFNFISPRIRPDHALFVFVFSDDYSFGLLQSSAHWLWFKMKCSKLKSDFRYTPDTVFDTFPWPQSASAKQIEAVAKAGREVRRVRVEALSKITGGLRAVYRTLELPGANRLKDVHAALDAAVLAAYGFSPKTDLLAQLLDLNHTVADRIARNEPVTAPGIPPNYPKPESLITDDCIRP
jgi:SAM-dependent methyltransferase